MKKSAVKIINLVLFYLLTSTFLANAHCGCDQICGKSSVCQGETTSYSFPSCGWYSSYLTNTIYSISGGTGTASTDGSISITWGSTGSGSVDTWAKGYIFGFTYAHTHLDVTIGTCVGDGCTASPITLSNPLSYNTALFETQTKIIANDAFKVSNGSTVILQAGEEIELEPNFEALEGSTFDAKIASCTINHTATNSSFMPDPSDTIVRICENKKITIYGDSIDSDAISFHWDFGNNQFSNLRNPTISYSTNGVFNVKVIINRLSGTIDTLTQPILISSLQEEISIGGNSQSGNYQTIQTSLIKITPNPNSGYFKLEVNFKSPFVLEIYDVLGRKIWNSQNNLTSGSFDINISSQINGIYYLKAISNDGIVTIKKIIKI